MADYKQIKEVEYTIRALKNKNIQAIMQQLKTEKTVTQLYTDLKREQSVVSQNLIILRRIGVVKTRRDGKYIYYSLNTPRMLEVQMFVDLILI